MTDLQQPRYRVLLTFRTRGAFLADYAERGNLGELRITGHPYLEVGDVVELELVFAEDLMVFRALGIVKEKTNAAEQGRAEVAWVGFLRSQDRTRQLLLEYANGVNRQSLRRRARRFSARIPVEYSVDQAFTRQVTDNISKDGAFIVTNEEFAAGTLLAVRLLPPGGGQPVSLTAEVVWRQKQPPAGVGVRFILGDQVKRNQVIDLVERLAREHPGSGGEGR